MSVLAIDACPGCGSGHRDAFDYGDAGLYRCSSCGLVHSRDHLPAEEIYVDGYLSGGTGRFGLDITHPVFQAYLEHVNARRVAFLAAAARPPGRLLDVGCGAGELLLAARAAGWTVTGVDLVGDAVRKAVEERGLDVRETLLEDSDLPEASFDVVCATHVLEHQVDGRGFLATLARWVRPGGHVFIEVPNWRSMHRRGQGEGWVGLRPREHLSHFEPATLASTFRSAGLDDVHVRTATYLDRAQTLNEALSDLGQGHRGRLLRPLARPFHPPRDDGEPSPGPLLWPLLHSAAWAFDRARVGTVLVATGRVR